MPDTPHDLTEALLAAARAAGAESADAVAIRGESVVVDIRAGTLEQAERAEGTDIGLRVLIGGRQANVSGSDTRPETLAALAERAVAMAREAPQDPHAGLADPSQLARDRDAAGLELCDPATAPAPETLMRMAQETEAAALGVRGVSQVQSASAAWSHRDMHIAASNGFSGGYARTDTSLSCAAIAGTGTGMERDADGDSRVFLGDLRGPEDIGACAGRRAAERIGARRPPTGAYPVLFDERVAATLIGHLLAAANGASVARGASWLRDRLDTAVLPMRSTCPRTRTARASPARASSTPRGCRPRRAPSSRAGCCAGSRSISPPRASSAWRRRPTPRAACRGRPRRRHGTWRSPRGVAAATRCCARWAPGCWSPR